MMVLSRCPASTFAGEYTALGLESSLLSDLARSPYPIATPNPTTPTAPLISPARRRWAPGVGGDSFTGTPVVTGIELGGLTPSVCAPSRLAASGWAALGAVGWGLLAFCALRASSWAISWTARLARDPFGAASRYRLYVASASSKRPGSP